MWTCPPAIFSKSGVCGYPLDATLAQLTALGYNGQLTLTNLYQTGTYTVVGGAGVNNSFAATTNTATPQYVNLLAEPTVIEFVTNTPVLAASNAGTLVMNCTLTDGPGHNIQIHIDNGGPGLDSTYNFYIDGSQAAFGTLTSASNTWLLEFDPVSSSVKLYLNSAAVTLSLSSYIPSATYTAILNVVEVNANAADAGVQWSAQLVSNFASMTTPGAGYFDICGHTYNPFTPAAVFANGVAGGWWDPSDITTLFQDAAGTVPVTAPGQSVMKMLDKSGNGNHAVQATLANAPIYRASGGKFWLEFSSASTTNFAVAAMGAQKYGTVVIGINLLSDTAPGDGIVAEGVFNADAGAWSLAAGTDYPSNMEVALFGPGPAYNIANWADSLNTPQVVTWQFQTVSNGPPSHQSSVQVNGTTQTLTWDSTSGIDGTLANKTMYIGVGGTGSSIPASMNFYGLVHVRGSVPLISTVIAELNTWMAGKV